MTTARVTCPRCLAAPGTACFGTSGMHAERTALDDTLPALDVGELQRERTLAVLALDSVARSRSHADARAVAEQALRAIVGACPSGCALERGHAGGHVYPASPPMVMDADLRARLARDSATLHDSTEAAR